ncbi:hypothetical protein [Arthrobacter sp.]|uniref:hypothetical protein n=1 Tax=Arthrobacter sp. TaxID=1667 RepID=UPI0026DF2D88|nr:hypothetical protein [Arthrobacter sp.]MDO5751877.1 hypothetical protein [Arthrobacter sp.]
MTDMPRYNPEPDPYRQPAVAMVAPTPPPIMNTIFYMLLAAAALQVIAGIFGIVHTNSSDFRAQTTEQLTKQNTPGITPEMIDVSVALVIGTLAVMTVLAVIGYVVIGLFIRKGMGWARIVGAILAVVWLIQLTGLSMPGGIATVLQILLGLAAMVLCFMQPTAGFFTARKNFRLANKVR